VGWWAERPTLAAWVLHTALSATAFLPTAYDVAHAADATVEEAAKGQSTGASLLLRYQPPTVKTDVSPATPAEYFDPATGKLKNEIWSRELFPGVDPNDPAQLDALRNAGADPAQLTTQGVARGVTMQGGSDESSRAYQTLRAADGNPAHAVTNMRAEAFLTRSREVIAGDSPLIDQILMSCDELAEAGPATDRTTQVPDIRACVQAPAGNPGSCTVTRNLVLEPLETKVVLTVTAAAPASGDEHWDEFGYPGPTADGTCRVSWNETQPEPSVPPQFIPGFVEQRNVGSWAEPMFAYEAIYATAYCGTHQNRTPTEIEAACQASKEYVLGYCRNRRFFDQYSSHQILGAFYGECTLGDGPPYDDWSSCPAGRQTACDLFAAAHYNACMGGGGTATPMNGTASLTASPLGAPTNQTGVTMLGTTVNVTETPFDLAAYGLTPGQYVIAGHAIGGSGVTSPVLTDTGRVANDWDYGFTVTTSSTPEFTVTATLYRISANDFTYAGCSQQDLANVVSGACSATFTCIDQQSPCRDHNGVQLCEAPGQNDGITELLTDWNAISTGLAPTCWGMRADLQDCLVLPECVSNGTCVSDCASLPVELQAECNAPLCWTDPFGAQVCLDSTEEAWVNNLGDPGYVDNCQELLQQNCRLLTDRPCVEGMEDPNNPSACLLREVRFDCGQAVTIPGTVANSSTTTCAGQFRCFGDECARTEAEQNPDFAKAATAATAINETAKDLKCDIAGDPNTCRVFEGTPESCRDPRGVTIGLIPDCCAQGRDAGRQGGSFTDYMMLAKYTYDLAQKPFVASFLSQSSVGTSVNSVLGPGSPIAKAAGSVSNAISSGFSSAMQWMGFTPVTAASQSAGVAGSVVSSATGFGPVQQFIATGVKNFLDNVGMSALSDQLFSSTAEGLVTDWAASGLGQMIGSIISVIGVIYLIYNILKILGSILFKCKQSELQFGIKVVNRGCHYIGTYCSTRKRIGPFRVCVIDTKAYCCYSSPFARIMNEQLKSQGLAGGWGTAREPNCAGIALGELANVDWERVDLSEWEAILFEAGLVPNPNDPPLNFVPTNAHPGTAAGGAEGVDSVTLNREAITTVMPTMDEARFLLKTQPTTQPDPELMPWYGP
jgi:hypothetical protein